MIRMRKTTNATGSRMGTPHSNSPIQRCMYEKRMRHYIILLSLLIGFLIDECGTKRIGGGSYGRGSSRGRISSPSRSGGSIFGGHSSRGVAQGYPSGGTGWGTRGSPSRGTGIGKGTFGGGSHKSTSWHRGAPTFHRSSYSKGSGIGSLARSSKFKSAIAGAAAGYLAYQAGKHLIRSAMTPMMWNNRRYYWGSNYYPSSGYGRGQMCSMPLDRSDPTFGNVYFEDGVSRPKEIVWSCNYDEYCCGYECCRRTGGSSYWGYGFGSANRGASLNLLLFVFFGLFLC
ncbi:hypothetical protein AB6A40_007161 [Gnathostoma spinigerum]|uniref:CX domain-containing protein n=1 Tax=Gnathostoma spinigerum TaxID=75299 RepID=A0ABD6EV52_9BILA